MPLRIVVLGMAGPCPGEDGMPDLRALSFSPDELLRSLAGRGSLSLSEEAETGDGQGLRRAFDGLPAFVATPYLRPRGGTRFCIVVSGERAPGLRYDWVGDATVEPGGTAALFLPRRDAAPEGHSLVMVSAS